MLKINVQQTEKEPHEISDLMLDKFSAKHNNEEVYLRTISKATTPFANSIHANDNHHSMQKM